ncbi:TonB-dependent receptor [Oceanicoccus sp. KOV_DT_Chl]|uniref:TonB-dependent receptor n=1 Tax=Oceanicoccus sp. KOV_DT_Chl TaxID=1904639 RepID=UPI00190E8CE5|nr:TonB-dependent receptor [Oceanicoccus sp. KOV_DT_Chl]
MSKLRQAIRNANRAKTTLVSGSLSALLAMTMAAAANAEEGAQLEEVVVTGIRGSLNDAMNTKRFANAVVDAISAEDIGKFPDKNVAEALGRVPGITISGDFGEGQNIAIRGLDGDNNITLVNGQAVGTAQWFVLSEAERNFNFEMLSSEMIAGVEVYKTAQADVDEGGIGGTVILKTRKPLQMEANTLNINVEGQYNDLAEDWDPAFSGIYSWKNADENFGVMVALSHQERTVRRETAEVIDVFGPSVTRLGDDFAAPTGAAEKGYTPWAAGSALFEQNRERDGVDVNLQWKPTANLDTNFHYFFSELKADNVNQNMLAIPFRGLFLTNQPATGTVTNGIVDSLEVSGGSETFQDLGWNNHMAYDNIYRDGSKAETEIIDFEGTYTGAGFELHGQIGTTTGKGVAKDNFFEFFAHNQDTRANFDYYNSGGNGFDVDYSRSPWLANPTDEMLLTAAFNQTTESEDTEDYLQLDGTLDVEFAAINQIKVGFKYRDREFTQERTKDNMINTSQAGDLSASLGTAGDYASGSYTIDHDETSQRSTTVFQPNQALMQQAFSDLAVCVDGDTAVCRTGSQFVYDASYGVQEDITSLYAMANFEQGNLRGNFGVRYVETETTSSAWDVSAATPVSTKLEGKYSEFLPSLNAVYSITDDIQARFSAGRTMARPAPFELTSARNLTVENRRGDTGNPELDPLIANQYDLGIEWYYQSGSMLSATVFMKDIQNFIYSSTFADDINGETFLITRPENGPSVTLEGVELVAQHMWDNGFGVTANYTYTDAGSVSVNDAALIDGDATLVARNITLPGVSKDSYNISAFYEQQLYSARINYNYRSEYFERAAESGDFNREEQARIDAQLSIFATENLTIRVEALNLTDEIIEQYHVAPDGVEMTTTQIDNGRRFFVGLNYQF